jgi:MinD-like ATPase involved in chromosome partitioning or flagellar assembly
VHDGVELFLRCVDRVEVLASVRGGNVDGLVIAGPPNWLDADTVEEARSAGIRAVGLARDPLDVEVFRSLGIAAMPSEPSIDEILTELDRDGVPLPPPPTVVSGTGRIVAVWGPKGSPGRSRIALEMATLAALKEPATLLVDADPTGGDLLQLLGVVEEIPTIVWAARSGAKKNLDVDALRGSVRRVGPRGPILLPGIARPELAADVSEKGLRAALELFRSAFELTVVDTGPSIVDGDPGREPGNGGSMTRCVLNAADRVVAVCRADPIGIKNFMVGLERLRESVDPDKVIVVANRVLPGREREIDRLLRDRAGSRPIALVPDRHEDVTRAVFAGRPVTEMKPGSEIPSALAEILVHLGSEVRRRGLLTRLGGRG